MDSNETAEELFELARERVATAVGGGEQRKPDLGYLVGKVRDTLNSLVYERTRRRPMILPVITEV
jgi:ribonuclease J